MVTFDLSTGSPQGLSADFPEQGATRITLDAALTEKRTRKVTLTKHPVEQGVKPSDHAELEPDVFSVDGIITNTPIAEADQVARGLGAGAPLDGNYIKRAIDFLDGILEAREAITIITETKTYANMVMTSLDMPRDASTGFAIQFSATFEQIRFVQTQAVRIPTTKVPQKIHGTDKQGKKVATPATDEEVGPVEGFLEAFGADPNAARPPDSTFKTPSG